MRTLLAVLAGIAMAFCALFCFAALADAGRTSASEMEFGASFGMLLLASILWMLTEIAGTLSRLLAESKLAVEKQVTSASAAAPQTPLPPRA